MPFASGNKKSQSYTDSRVAATDDAIVLQSGGFLFAPKSDQPNATIGGGTSINWTLIALAGLAMLGLFVFWRVKSN